MSGVSYMFAVSDLEVSSSLTYVPLITNITFESIKSIFVILILLSFGL
jgi:hypothetical protein